jgi:peptide/nickel transport system substrate-binding protein
MVDTALFGFGRSTSIPWPQHSLGYDAALDQSYTFDLGKARQLLEAANWDANTTVSLSLARSVAATRQMAEIYQADLATVGAKLTLQEIEDTDFVSRLVAGRFGGAWMFIMAFMNLSPATFLNSALPVRVPNASHFATPHYVDLIARTTAATDVPALTAELHEVTRIMLDESFVAPIAESAGHPTGLEVARRVVNNATWDVRGFFAYQDIWLDSS